MTHISAPEDVGALWLITFQRALGRASHDVKDALNGVSVNLEVIRSRAERPDVPASAVAQFAEAAGNQLERLTTLLDAVLTLGRPEREPVDVSATLRRIATLCNASSSPADAPVVASEAGTMGDTTSRLDGSAVRLALLAPVLEASVGVGRGQRASTVACKLDGSGAALAVTIAAEGRRVGMPEQVADSLRTAGVRWTDDVHGLTLTFPRA